MKLGYTILYVSDVAATLEFYSAAFGLLESSSTKEVTTVSWPQEKRLWRLRVLTWRS